MTLTLTSCFAQPGGFATNRETFYQLNEVLPTASTEDTEQTRLEVGTFRRVFLGLCPVDICGGI